MSRTFIRQDIQIRHSVTYDDTLASGVALETGASSIEDDLNGLRSQMEKAIGQGDWWAPLAGRNLTSLDTDLTDIESKKILCRANILTDVTVPAAQNFVVLNVAGSEAPTQVAAVALTQDGAVVAQSANPMGPPFETHELVEVAGPDALHPKNLMIIKDAVTGNALQSNGMDIYGLMQYEFGAADGATFDDAAARVKISFVRANATLDDLEAVPVADIQNVSFNYNYTTRTNLDAIPEDCWLPTAGGFVDQSAAVDVTLDNAIDNQSGAATQTQNIDWDIADGNTLAWTSDSGATDILALGADAGGDTVTFNSSSFVVNSSTDAFFNEGAVFDVVSGSPINIGTTAGQIDSSAPLTVTTTGANDMTVGSGQELFLDDANQTGSTWAQTGGIKLSETTAEWDAFEATFGEVSILDAIVQAQASSNRVKGCAEVTSPISADADAGGVAGGINLDTQLPDMSAGSFLGDYDVYLNGQLLEGGADASANNDYYPGTSLVDGQLKFEFNLRPGDKICVICYA